MNDTQRAAYRAYKALCEATDKALGLPGHGSHIRSMTPEEQAAWEAFEATWEEDEAEEPTLIDCPHCHGAHYTGQVCPLEPKEQAGAIGTRNDISRKHQPRSV